VEKRRRFRRQHLLRLVQFGAFDRGEPSDLGKRQLGEELEESFDIRVLAVAPILPVLVWRQSIRVEPHRA
jgi:hypothetical protein